VTGPTETEEYLCMENPCGDAELDCECASSACQLPDGRSRLCYVALSGAEDVDLLCQDQAQ
jgi:hypothetical protein